MTRDLILRTAKGFAAIALSLCLINAGSVIAQSAERGEPRTIKLPPIKADIKYRLTDPATPADSNACETDAKPGATQARLKVWQLMQGQNASAKSVVAGEHIKSATIQTKRMAAGADSANGGVKDLQLACDAAQAAMVKINADPDMLAKSLVAVDSSDSDALQKLLADVGLTEAIIPGAQFHAVNTKGTGAGQGRHAINTKGTPIGEPKPVIKGREYGQLGDGGHESDSVHVAASSGWIVVVEKIKIPATAKHHYVGHVSLIKQ